MERQTHMRTRHLAATAILSAMLLHPAGAAAQFTSYSQGTEWVAGKPYPASAQFSCEKGRSVLLLSGQSAYRMAYLEDQKILRILNLTDKTYIDLQGGVSEGLTAQVEQQLSQLPPEQRAMAEQMMAGAMAKGKSNPPVYVYTDKTDSILGYNCTLVNVMEGSDKRADFWETKSTDFALTADERASVVGMQKALGNDAPMVRDIGGGGAAAFQWDTDKDGFPLRTHCYRDGVMTLELTVTTYDRNAIADSLFEVPKGFRKAM
jgi:hypothetical protein